MQKGRTSLCVDVTDLYGVRRLWKADEDGWIPAWAPGTTGLLGNCLSEDDELRQWAVWMGVFSRSWMKLLAAGVANAGSWAVWMGVFSRSWVELLVAGGLTYKRACIATGKTSTASIPSAALCGCCAKVRP
jgi:hypothetical protein